jgi:hypothetical protein
MSFLDDLIDFGSTALDFLGGSGIGSSIARTALTGYALNQVTQSINKDNETATAATTQTDYGVREQVDPNTDTNIPVIYGTAYIGPKVVDAVLSGDNMTMWYCLAICEQTGRLLSTNQGSQLSFQGIYWNQNRIQFQTDGITVASFIDEDGVADTTPAGLIKVYCFSGGSNRPVNVSGYSYGNSLPAYSIFPNWTSNHQMNDLVFALVRVDYDKAKQVTGIGNMEFKITNTLKMPGDVLYDYMTNARYGAGIAPEEINT